jgi:hypothetical protein
MRTERVSQDMHAFVLEPRSPRCRAHQALQHLRTSSPAWRSVCELWRPGCESTRLDMGDGPRLVPSSICQISFGGSVRSSAGVDKESSAGAARSATRSWRIPPMGQAHRPPRTRRTAGPNRRPHC